MRPPTDWKQLAASRGFALSDEDLVRIVDSLGLLDAWFRPLIELIPHDEEPATTLSPDSVTVR